MRVGELMTSDVATCRADDSLSRAAQLMWDRDCGAVPVLNESGAVIGMITDRDICMAAYTRGLPLDAIQVQSAMSSQLHSVRPDDRIEDAQALMQRARVRRIPVLDQGRLVGILSMGDFFTRAPQLSQMSRREPGLRPEVLVETLLAISTPPRGGARTDRMQQQGARSP